mmetsp:Transcript_61175/g.157773  ORF Transcript_61175/g.157773 Transcript_61175/m.157773 type:complete len:194 (+) Transcript_61175:980-1561(+)
MGCVHAATVAASGAVTLGCVIRIWGAAMGWGIGGGGTPYIAPEASHQRACAQAGQVQVHVVCGIGGGMVAVMPAAAAAAAACAAAFAAAAAEAMTALGMLGGITSAGAMSHPLRTRRGNSGAVSARMIDGWSSSTDWKCRNVFRTMTSASCSSTSVDRVLTMLKTGDSMPRGIDKSGALKWGASVLEPMWLRS